MKKCTSCQAENPDSAKFCRKCGKPFVKQEQDAPAPGATTDSTEQSEAQQKPGEQTETQPKEGLTTDAGVPNNPSSGLPQPVSNPAEQSGQPGPTSGVHPTPVPGAQPPQNINVQSQSPLGQPSPDARYSAGQPTQPFPQAQPTQPTQQFQQAQATQPNQPPLQQPMPGAAPGMAPVQQTVPTQSRLFFNWLLAALKKPSLRMIKPAWYACIPIFVEAMIISLLVTIWESRTVSAVSHAFSPVTSIFGYSSSSASSGSSGNFGFFFRGFIAVAFVLYVMTLSIFIGKKIYGDPDGFRQAHDAFAQIIIPFAILHLVLVLLSLVGASVVAGVIFLFSVGFMSAVPSYLIATSRNTHKLDSFWLWLIFMVVAFLIFLLVMIIFISIAGEAFMSAIFSLS